MKNVGEQPRYSPRSFLKLKEEKTDQQKPKAGLLGPTGLVVTDRTYEIGICI